MSAAHWRLPAEWEAQDAILLAWPHEGTDWRDNLDAVRDCYLQLITAILGFQPVLLVVRDPSMSAQLLTRLHEQGVDTSALYCVYYDYDDTWCRDIGPMTLVDDAGGYRFLDFRFTGWGGKFEAQRDDALVGALVESGRFVAVDHHRVDFALEGGAIESDGRGTLLSTWRCLHQRHPQLSDERIEAQLRSAFCAEQVHWLHHGYLIGDDTDAHIDTLVRFASPDSLVYQACDDAADPHFDELAAMAAELRDLRCSDGSAYQLYVLPWPKPIAHSDGRRLAASYANYLIINDALLMPSYGDAADEAAAEVLAQVYPGRKVISIDCRALIVQNGSLHCVSMQLPRGVLNGPALS